EITAYESDISTQQEAIEAYEEELAQQTQLISDLEKAISELESSLTYDGGMFQWPVPSYKYISSDYGYRINPITGAEQFHSGVDMAAASGAPILAAYDGQVVAAAYSSSMGNYIMIDHGDALYTIYMHCSALYVSTGATVSKGDKIAAVGTTGSSTGNHLHFGVRLNGSYVNPWNYLS
ncbi:MAG: M23 family metallopeptidase, partial [Eubacteriales bacterium]